MIDIDDENVDWAQVARGCYHITSVSGGVATKGYHRTVGPLLSETGRPLWYWQGNQYPFESWCALCGHSDEEIMLLRLKYL
jgi:hypothetical protein